MVPNDVTTSAAVVVQANAVVSSDQGRIKRWTGTVKKFADYSVKWLNGLPTEEPEFDPDRMVTADRLESIGNKKKKRKKKRNLFKRSTGNTDNGMLDEEEMEKQQQMNEKSRIFQVPWVDGAQYQLFGNNAIKTAKYTMLTFVPKNLYEQFHRVANFYFLLVIILQFIPLVSNVSPWIAMIPLTVIVVATAIKDALEDWKRHKSDNKVNYSLARVLRRAHSPITPIEYSNAPSFKAKSNGERFQEWLFRMKRRLFGLHTIDEQDNIGMNRWKAKYWRDIAVGDLIIIQDGDSIPADILIISTSEVDGRCFVETMNLDGETNLKIKYALPETQWVQTVDDATELQMLVETELPSSNMHSFNGKIAIPCYDSTQPREDVIPVTLDEVLLRGCRLRNTNWIIGLILYTGPDTKLMLNTGVTPSKRSRIERQMNPQIVLSFILLFVICVACAIVQSSLVSSKLAKAPYWYSSFGSKVYASGLFTGFLTFWSSMVLFQTLVPISLYITVEMCKTIQAYFIHQDIELYDEETGKKCVPRAWNISDDLGQIEYIFSDKTGTLTRNVMEFRQCSINGIVYGHLPQDLDQEEWSRMESEMQERLVDVIDKYTPPIAASFVDPALVSDMMKEGAEEGPILEFFKLLALCHTVLADPIPGCADDPPEQHNMILEYKAQSPDEAALVGSARDLGLAFLGREHDTMTVKILNHIHKFTLLDVIEFTSTRKRMSVILRDEQTGKITLYCKGADNVIMERLERDTTNPAVVEETMSHLDRFAASGLRTLCLAKRTLTDGEYREWSERYRQASATIDNRDLMMDAEADTIEQSLMLLGATAIEDRLQEGVPECIETLQEAGIKIWVLTGDKLETAINIALSCRLLTPKSCIMIINGHDEESVRAQLQSAKDQMWSKHYAFGAMPLDKPVTDTDAYAMVIEGHSLRFALQHALRPVFIALACRCKSVVCCRTSPLQKAKVVELVRRSKNAMTLAIGDGANDVSMLQAADVGVGVSGAEGMQAVMASDYAVTQFRHLTRLLLLHGHWSYHRSAETTLCSFHKNIAFVVSGFWYQWSCAFTSSYIYDYMYANFFNILLAMPPILCLGCFDQDISQQTAMAIPQLYRRGINQSSYSLSLFWLYMMNGLWQSAACFYCPRLAYATAIVDSMGRTEGRTFLGNAVGMSVIISVNVFVLLNTKAWNGIVLVSFVVTMAALLAVMIISSFIHGMTLFGSVSQLAEARFYFVMLLSVSVAVCPQLLFKLFQTQLHPNDLDIIREAERDGRLGEIVDDTVHRRAQSASVEEMLAVGSMTIKAPEAAIPALPRPIGATRNSVTMNTASAHPQPATNERQKRSKLSKTLSSVADRIKRHLSIINMGSHRMERHTGYAFSQQDRGTASIVMPRAPSPAVRPRH